MSEQDYDWVRLLRHLGACDGEARRWADKEYARDGRASVAWECCERGDWMLWLVFRAGVNRRLVVRAACACARLALVHVPEGEDRPLRAIETAEAWTRREATIAKVHVHASAAAHAAAHAYTHAAAHAYTAAAHVAYTAHAAYTVAASVAASAAHAAYTAHAHAVAAHAYTHTAAHTAAHAARADALRRCADLVREHIPIDVMRTALLRVGRDCPSARLPAREPEGDL